MLICLEQREKASVEGIIKSTGEDIEPSTYVAFHTLQKNFWCAVVFETLDKKFLICEANGNIVGF